MAEIQFTAAITHEGDWYVARCLQVSAAGVGRPHGKSQRRARVVRL